MSKPSIGVVVGSLRRDSFSRKLALHLSRLLEEKYDVKFLDIASLPMFNEDLDNEADIPQSWQVFRQEVKAVDAVLFVTPEYNRSMPAALKNALDVASRPWGKNAWSGKPGAVLSFSVGKLGGFGANQHLRQSASCLNILMMQQPEAYVGEIYGLMDKSGALDEKTLEFMKKFTAAFTISGMASPIPGISPASLEKSDIKPTLTNIFLKSS